MRDAELIEGMLGHYRGRFPGWEPPAPGVVTGVSGGFSGGPFGLAVRFVLRGAPAARECLWLETSRMGGTSLLRLVTPGGEPECLDAMQTFYVLGPTDADTARAKEEMWAQNAAFWNRVGELDLAEDLPMHTAVNALLTSGPDEPPAQGGAGGP